MTSENPDAVVFIIGTNDASIANTYDGNGDGTPDWEKDYREKIDTMMRTFVGGDRHRTVFWLGPPTLGDSNLDRGAQLLGRSWRRRRASSRPTSSTSTRTSCSKAPTAATRASSPTRTASVVQMRISDGVHFTVDGAEYLGDIVWKLLDKRWKISRQAAPSQPIEYTIAEGSNDYVPGVGYHYSSGSNDSSGSSSDTTPATEPAERDDARDDACHRAGHHAEDHPGDDSTDDQDDVAADVTGDGPARHARRRPDAGDSARTARFVGFPDARRTARRVRRGRSRPFRRRHRGPHARRAVERGRQALGVEARPAPGRRVRPRARGRRGRGGPR